MSKKTVRDKTRAIVLAALMVLSVFAGTIALSGAAVASAGGNPAPTADPGTLEVSVTDGSGNVNATFRVNKTSNTINVSYAGAKQDVNVTFADGNSAKAIDLAIGNSTSENDTVIVGDGEFETADPVELNENGISVLGQSGAVINASGVQTAVFIKANSTTFSGFEVVGDADTKEGIGLQGNNSQTTGDIIANAVITDNIVRGMANDAGGNPSVYGIHSFGRTSLDNVTVSSNKIKDISRSDSDSTSEAINLGPFAGNESEVSDNTISNINGTTADSGFGIVLYEDGSPNNVTVSGNTLDGVFVGVFSDGLSGSTGVGINDNTDTQDKIASVYEQNDLTNVSIDGENRLDESGSPSIQSVEIEDIDTDGDIERVTITATESLTDSEFDTSDFEIGGQNPGSVSTGASAYDEVVVLNFSNSDLDGTGPAVISEASTASATLTDLAGNTDTLSLQGQTITDSAAPVVEDITPTPAEVNIGNAPTDVTVDVTFSEDVSNVSGTFELFPTETRQNDDGRVTVTIDSVNNDTVTATTDSAVGSPGTDYFAGADIPSGAVTDGDGNDNAAFNTSQADGFDRLLDVDRVPPQLADATITTLDSDNDGQVDRLEVEFDDDLNDDTVDPADFTVTNPNATVDSVDTGATANDNIVFLNVSGLPADDTSVTPTVTVDANSIEDTAGNTGPAVSGGETQEAVDGADPVILELTVDDTGDAEGQSSNVVINNSDTPAAIQIQVDFSENLTSAPTATVLNNDGTTRTSTSKAPSSFDGDQITFDLDNNITDNNEETALFVEVSGGDDGSGNSLVTFNQSRITVDTVAPTTTVDASLADGLQNGEIDISDNVTVAGDDIAQIQVNITDASGSTFETFSSKSALDTFLSSFDTTQFEDGTVTVEANATDTAGNLGNTDSGTLDVDNEAPVVTINEPAETTAAQSDSALSVNVTIDEPNIDGDAQVVLSGGNNTIAYDVPVADGDNEFQLKLNTSANATAPNSILPNQSATNGSFETKVVYDLSVTVDDEAGQSTTVEQADTLFLDDTPPENFSLLAPDDPAEYGDNGRNSLVVAYGYTEDNTDSVTVELVDEAGNVDASVQVDESQYTDDGVIKSFELEDAIDFTTLDDGRYNVSVTVTDLAGNELTETTTNAPVAVNNNEESDGEITFDSTDATADLNATTEQVTVNVTYNVSVEDLTDTGDLDQTEAQLDDVTIDPDADLVTATVTYYDESVGKYTTINGNVALSDFTGVEVADNETITATATASVNSTDVEGLADDDRVLNYTVNVNSGPEITIDASGNVGSATAVESVSDDSATLVSQDPVEPEIESVEVRDVDTPADQLVVTFTRPVEEIGQLTPSDFGYQDVSGDGSNFVDSVSDVDGDRTIILTLNQDVTAEDVGTDIVSLQDGSVLQSTQGVTVSPDSGTVQETTPPELSSADVGANATEVTVTFDQAVQAADGGDLTAANFTYLENNPGGASGITSVEQTGPRTVVVTLNASATESDLISDAIAVAPGEVVDQFGNANDAQLVAPLDENIPPTDLEIVAPTEPQIKQSDDTLQISYEYVENIPDGTDVTVVDILDENGNVVTSYQVDDSQFVGDGSTKTIAIDLDDPTFGDLPDDGAYDLRVYTSDSEENVNTAILEDGLVLNDEPPEVDNVNVDPDSDVAPDETINVSYNYQNPGVNATSVTVHIVDADDVGNFTNGDFEDATFSQVTKEVDHASGLQTVQVDLSGLDAIEDNDDYEVFVTATDQSDLTNLNTDANPIIEGPVSSDSLDVNAEQPTLESVETNAGSDTVTVTFSEPVVAADGEISLDDFAYQDISDSGASAIEDVQQVGPQTVELTLDSPVTADDLGSDLVNVRLNALADTDGQNARIVPLNATALADTTDPAVDVTAGEVNAQNDENYAVTVTTEPLSEPTDITVTVTGPDNGTVTAQTSAQGTTSVSLNVSTLADGELDIEAVATDAAGNNDSASTTAVKDTVAPTVEVAAANPAGSADDGGKTRLVSVTFSEPVTGVSADAFDLGTESYTIDDVIFNPFITGDQAALLLLNQSVTPDAINDSSVLQVSAPGVTDQVGNEVANGVKLTDQDVAWSGAPDHKPGIEEVSSETGSATVTIVFDEVVEAGDGTALSAANLTYVDTNNASAGEVVSVNQTSPTTVQVTLDQPLTDADRALDRIGVETGEVFDLAGTSAPDETVPFGLEGGLSASSSGDTVTVQVTTGTNVSDALSGSVELAEVNTELAELEGFVLEDRFNTTLSAEDFTEVEPGVFQATVQVPEDGAYSVSGLVSGELQTVETVVDTQAPRPIDATILSVTSEAQLDDTRDTTRLRVLFNEPVDASAISPDDVAIEGFDGQIVAVEDAGSFGAVEVILEGDIQTGDSPAISIAGSSYTDLSGTTGVADGSTVVHTDVLQLDEDVNFVSVPAASGGLDISELPLDKIESISRYNAQTGEFEVFIPGAPNNPFSTLEGGEGYIIRMEGNTSATVPINVANEPTGQNGPNAVELSEGFNLVGHYQEDQQSVQQALSSVTAGESGQFEDTVFVVLKHNEETGEFTYESYRAGEFSTLEDGEAYWVFVTDDQTYTEAPLEESGGLLARGDSSLSASLS